MNYFLDTSALVKIYHLEDESDRLIDIFNSSAEIFVSELSVIEYHSVAHRKLREQLLEKDELVRVIERFEIDLADRFDLLMFNPEVIVHSQKALQAVGGEVFVRTLDIIQIGFYKSYLKDEDLFLSFDLRQNIALEKLKQREFFDN